MMSPSLLARGPVATVYAIFGGTGPVALKVFPTRLDSRTRKAVERERAKLTALASSAAILPVQELVQWGGRHALRMEMCHESLTIRVRRVGPLSPDDVAALGHTLSLALAAAHGVGVLHGGISPENVLFRAPRNPVLADFGVPLREAFARDPMCTIEFVSPETLRTRIVTERTDLYALGAVLHFALTGQSPHPGRPGEQPGERVLRVLGSPVPAISRAGIPVELSTVIARLLAADPEHRPPDAAWVATRLAAVLPRLPSEGNGTQRTADALGTAEAAPPLPALSHPRSRVATVITALAGLLTLTLAFVVVFLLIAPHPRQQPAASPTAQVGIDLAEPTDLADHVVLNWTSASPLDFAVVIDSAGEPQRYLLAERNHMLKIPVDPGRKYCFRIRGTDGDQVYESRPKPIRGAVCPQ
jgi:eukaryotic-like serine/threonine-protein kinase